MSKTRNRKLYYLRKKPCPKCNSRLRLPRKYKTSAGNEYLSSHCVRCLANKTKRFYNKDYHAAYRAKNIEKIRAYQREYYYPKHKERNCLSARRLRQRQVFNDQADIKAFYKACPKGMTVDHIVPLNGKYVSGLHTIANLQYLSQSANSRKGNKYLHDMA